MAPQDAVADRPRIRVVPADAESLPLVRDLLSEAAQWSRDQGIEGLWRVPYPIEWIRPSLERGEVFVAWRAGVPVGTLTFRWTDDPTWGPRPSEAGYVHKLAVRRALRGQGIGAEMLDWAGDRAARAGRSWLRLDCLRSHRGLRSHYRSLGFAKVGEATVEGNVVTLLQRPAERRRRPSRSGPPTGNIK